MVFPRVLPTQPSAAIRNDYNKVSKYCHSANSPLVLTKNGTADLVVMSTETYNNLMERLELEAILAESERQVSAGVQAVPFDEFFDDLHRMIDERAKN